MSSLVNLDSSEALCPMCGARRESRSVRCVECGELSIETGESVFSERELLVLRARRWTQITGFFVAIVGFFTTLAGVGGSWEELSQPAEDREFIFFGSVLIVGICFLVGGIQMIRHRSMGYWFVQPINLALLVAQLFRLDKFNIPMFALTLAFLFLCQNSRKLLQEAGSSKLEH